MKKPQAYTEFQPLEEVLVGRCYDTSFLDTLDVPFTKQTKRLMTHLLDETEEDYQKLIDTLKNFDVKVYRPSANEYNKSKHMYQLTGAYLMNPRDDQIVIDNKIIFGQMHSNIGKGFAKAISPYKNSFLPDPALKYFVGASIVRLGEDIIVDSSDYSNTQVHVDRLRKYFEPLGYNIIYTKTHDFKFKNKISHGDSVFAVLKPGLILHAREDSHYSENLFKGWDLIKVEAEDSLKQALRFNTFTIEKKNYIKECSYAFEDDKYNDERWFAFLNKWFSCLVGYSQETHFDVNCLVVNEENVIFSSYNKEIFKKLEKHKINPIVCPFRHRLFWDGGLHCITLDLKRRGSREKYI